MNAYDERGSMSIEIVLLTPALVAAIIVIAAGARFVDAREETSGAAFAAARAASLTSNQEAAVAAGTEAARHAMSDRGQSCATLDVTIDAHDFAPGGTIRATVSCLADLSDLSGFGILPGHKTFTATAAVPLDQHRDFS
jgi:Flp pilus assembly protein TadG